MFLSEGGRGYNSSEWGTIGRDMIARVLRRKCKMAKYADDNSVCPEMKIYPQNMFHPFAWQDDPYVWDTTETNTTFLDLVKDSYAVHLWSSRTQFFELNTDDKSVVNVIAANNCPRIYRLESIFDY